MGREDGVCETGQLFWIKQACVCVYNSLRAHVYVCVRACMHAHMCEGHLDACRHACMGDCVF